jgi:hypothetical protein
VVIGIFNFTFVCSVTRSLLQATYVLYKLEEYAMNSNLGIRLQGIDVASMRRGSPQWARVHGWKNTCLTSGNKSYRKRAAIRVCRHLSTLLRAVLV